MTTRVTRPRRSPRPPRLAEWLLHRVPLGDRRGDIEADLRDLFLTRLAARGRRHARFRFWLDVLSLRRLHRAPAATRLPRSPWWSSVGADVSHAGRVYRRQAGVVSVAVAGLALAIGVSTPVFSITNAFSFRPLSVPEPRSVVTVLRTVAASGSALSGWPYADYLRLHESARLAVLEGSTEWRARVTEDQADEVSGEALRIRFVTPGFLETFGARLRYGRGLESRDHAVDAAPVAVLHHAFWEARLKSDPGIVGRTVFVGRVPVVVVGVFDASFGGPFPADQAPVMVMPLAATATVAPAAGEFRASSTSTLDVIGRLRPGATVASVQDEITSLATGLGWVRAAAPGVSPQGVRVQDADAPLTRDKLVVFAIAMTIVGLILILASTNIANILLAGSTSRAQEIGCRLALGATRGRIIRQLLTESLCLGMASGVLGLFVSTWSTPLAAWLIDLPPGVDLSPDVRVYGFVAVLAIATGLVAGIAPARHGARGDVLAALKGGTPQAGTSRRAAWLRSTFIAIQAAASIILLVLTALFGRALVKASTLHPGFDYDRLVALSAFPTTNRSETLPAGTFLQMAQERLRAMPDVADVALVEDPPYGPAFHPIAATLEGRRYPILRNKTSAGYFKAIGLPILRGRAYTEAEVAMKENVAVISAQIARDFWPGVDPLGDTLARVKPSYNTLRVIGVAADATARFWPPNYHGAPSIYLPLDDPYFGRVIVRMVEPADDAPRPVEQALAALDPGRQVTSSLVSDGLRDELRGPAIFASVAGIIGMLALGLAVIGVAGVTAFVVGQRRREIGIRLAIGASRWQVVRGIFLDNMRPVVFGLLVGLGVAAAATVVIARVLIVSAHDPLSFAVAIAVLLGSATVGVILPARRAARVDPAAVLKES